MRSSLTSLLTAGSVSRLSIGLVFALGTLASTELVAHAQTTAPAPSATGTTEGTDSQKATSDPSQKKPEADTGTSAETNATTAKATAETTAPAKEETAPKAGEEPEKKETHHAVYVSGDFGFTRADMAAFSDSTGFDKSGANGFVYGFGLGYRQDHLRIGARFHVNDTTEFDLWSVMAEVGYGLGLRPISPVFSLHAGYIWDTRIDRPVIAKSLPNGNTLTPAVDVRGLRVGAEVVGNVWVSETIRVGPFVGFDLLFLHRDQLGLPQSIYPIDDTTRNNALFSGSGSGTGYIFNAGIRGTFDIGF